MPPHPLKKHGSISRLAASAVPYYGVITEMTLEKDKNSTGIAYSKIKFNMRGRLSAEDAMKMKALQQAMKPMLEAVQIEEDPFEDEN